MLFVCFFSFMEAGNKDMFGLKIFAPTCPALKIFCRQLVGAYKLFNYSTGN